MSFWPMPTITPGWRGRWAADDRGEDRARRVVAREARLHHAGAVVAHQSRNLIVSHCLVSCESVFDLCRGGGAARQPKERGRRQGDGSGVRRRVRHGTDAKAEARREYSREASAVNNRAAL